MPAFDYKAYDSAGKRVSGVTTADSERHARRLLKEKQLLVEEIREVSQSPSAGVAARREARVNNFDLSLLLQQQAILIQSGLPLEDALRMTIEQAETDKQRRMLQSWRSEIVEGRSFSRLCAARPTKFPRALLRVSVLARRAVICMKFCSVLPKISNTAQKTARPLAAP